MTIRLSVVLFVLAPLHAAAVDKIIYVDDSAMGAHNGRSWQNAFVNLQDGLSEARLSSMRFIEIRVAQGMYRPDQGIAVTPGDREETFQLSNFLTLKGGYAGVGEPDPNARDIELYETILSGDLLGNDAQVNDPCDLLDEPTRFENSMTVVVGSGTDETAVLDGFTIEGGRDPSISMGPPAGGAGMYISSGSPTLLNCIFVSNAAFESGGGLYNVNSHPTLMNCTFTKNYAGGGAGMSNLPAWLSSQGSNPTLTNCMFSYNYALDGGGMHNHKSSPRLISCSFNGNRSFRYGAGIYNGESNPVLTNCTFSENSASSGGGIYDEDNSSLIITNCVFRDNLAEAAFGGGIYNEGANDLILAGCTFSGNTAKRDGGGIFNRRTSSTLTNCMFTGNTAYGELPYTSEGGGLYAFGDAVLTNCTFSGNWAEQGCAIFKYSFSDLTLTNCILWDGGNEIFQTGVVPNITYSNIQGGWEGGGNIDTDPWFAELGYWDVNDTPDDPNDDVWVDGDYHLKSQAGRWDAVSQSWVKDDVTSPCIDAGDPMTPIGLEPFPNGGVVNMGAYGGSSQASKSYFGQTPCETIVAGDINGDCKVDLADLALLSIHWLWEHSP